MKGLREQVVEFKETQKGEITVFLCLVFLVMISLIGALVESVSIHLARSDRRMRLEMSLQSVFAEYDKTLLEQYEIFALDGTYKTERYEERLLLDRIAYYGGEETQNQVHSVEFLSDNNGMPFYRGAVQYVRNQYGLKENAEESEGQWKDAMEKSKTYLEEMELAQKQMEEKLQETEESLPQEDNPLVAMEEVKKQGLVKTVLPKDKDVSGVSIQAEKLASQRTLREGNYPQSDETGTLEDVMFRVYLLEQFPSYAKGEAIQGFSYGVEYLLYGNQKDQKNLEKVLQKILVVRLVPNYAYLKTDSVKKAEVKALATSLCSLLRAEGIAPLVEQILLFAWAYGESVAELQVLMDGGTLATKKTKENWLLSLAELPLVGTTRHTKEEGVEKGLDYEGYLGALLLLTPTKPLTMRALDLVECGTGLRADACITRVQIQGRGVLRRRITYEFQTQYAYR